MSLVLQSGLRRNLPLYTAKGDSHILQVLSKYTFLTVEQAAGLMQRNIIATRRRLMQLYRAGILNRAQENLYAPHLYFLAEKGGIMAAEHGYLPSPRWINQKAPTHVAHDLLITEFHLELEKALHDSGHILSWEQWRGDMADLLDPDGNIDLIPDARFQIDDEEPSLLEVVRSYESGYRERESSLVAKLKAYRKLGIRRVFLTMPTPLRIASFLAKIEEDLPTTQFWFTDEDSFHKNIMGKIWWTPKNFRERTYSILKPEP